jgi:hypothetical protein
MSKLGVITVPTRYEGLREVVGPQGIGRVLIETPADLQAIKEAVVEVSAAAQGKLLFLLGQTGAGKTTLAASSQVYLASLVVEVVTPPPDFELPLADLPAWLNRNVPAENLQRGIVIVNLDGREMPPVDPNAQQAAVVNLNAYFRRTKNLLALWPVINRQFAENMVRLLNEVGGASALVGRKIHEVVGLDQKRFYDALGLILQATGTRLEDAAITRTEAEALVEGAASIGEYLSRVHDLVVKRYDLGNVGATLPRLSIVVTSNGDSADACRMLRRGNKFLADPERMLTFSRSNVADDWRASAKTNARHSLPFISSLFEVRLINLTASAVVNACAFSDNHELQSLVRLHYPSPVKQNGANLIANTSLMRSLQGTEDVGPTGAQGSEAVSNAYAALQEKSKDAAFHLAINKAIIAVLTQQLNFPMPGLQFEYRPHNDKELRVDTWFQRGDRPEALEFTHRKAADLKPATISSYVLGKVRDYARDYSLLGM